MITLPVSIALVFILLTSAVLYLNWNSKRQSQINWMWPLVSFGTGVGIFAYAAGIEYAVVYCLLLLSLLIWLGIFVINNANISAFFMQKGSEDHKQELSNIRFKPTKQWLMQAARLLLGLVLASASSLALSLVFVPLSGISEVNSLVIAAFLFPILWSVFFVWLLADSTLWRSCTSMLLIASSAFTFLWMAQ